MFLTLLTIANLCYYFDNFIGWAATSSFFLIVPGYLLLSTFRHEIKSKWEIFGISLGLSILLMIFAGLALNSTHILGVNAPLTAINIYVVLDAIMLYLIFLNRKSHFITPRISKPTKEKLIVYITLTLLPILAIGGAIRLNNGASNILTMLMFVISAIVFVVLTIRKNLTSLYPIALIMIGLSVLLTVSLRSWSISGHDIQREYYVMQATSKAAYWNISSFRDTYNACLSISILPTILAKITGIPDPYVYKVVFQIIFAMSLSSIYLFMKRVSSSRTALIGTFLFISFPTFLNDLPWLNRQEIAFVFFSLLMLTAFTKMARQTKTVLTILWLIAIVLTHYSSSYVTLGALFIAAIAYSIMKRKKINIKPHYIPLLSVPIILITLVFTFLWNSQITSTTRGLRSTITESISGMLDHSGAQSNDVSYSILFPKTKNPIELLNNYAGDNSSQVNYIGPTSMPITTFGQNVNKEFDVKGFNNIVRSLSPKIIQLLLLLGIFVIWLESRRISNKLKKYFVALSLSFVILLALQTILPQLSVDYGTLRFFQQALIVLGVPIVIGAEALFGLFGRLKLYITPIIFGILFLHLSGFIPQLTGGYPAQMSLNNSGSYYESYYVTNYDETAVVWQINTIPISSSVAMDDFARTRLDNKLITPSFTISSIANESNSNYIFEDNANVATGAYQVGISSNTIRFSISSNTANNRNRIYSNGGDIIYK